MALSDLIERLERDTDTRITTLLEEAEAQARQIEADAQARADNARAMAAGRRRREREAVHARELAVARQKARTDRIRAEVILLDRAKAQMLSRLPELETRAEYAAELERLLREALFYVDRHPVRIRARPATAARLRPLLRDESDAELSEDQDAPVGLIVETLDGSTVVDNSIASRLDRMWPLLAIDLINEVERS